MKKTRFILFLFVLLIPFMVKADDSGRKFSSELLTKESYVGSTVQYVVNYSSNVYGMDKGESKTGYIKFASDIFKVYRVGEYNTKKSNVKLDYKEIIPGVVKFTFTANEDFKQIDYKIIFELSVYNRPDSINKNETTTIELLSSYEYENPTCEDCDPFWLGVVENSSKKTNVSIYLDESRVNNSNETTENPIVDAQNVEKNTSNQSNKILSYILLGSIVVLVILVAMYFLHSKKDNVKE